MHILLADDHPLFLEALRTLVERNFPDSQLDVVGDFAGADRALGERDYDLSIVDLHMPGCNGFAGIERLLERYPATPLVVISGVATASDVARAIAGGAKGFLPKTLPISVLAAALQVVATGGTYVPAAYAASLSSSRQPDTFGRLTPREAEVLNLLANGRSNKEIGRTLDLQEITIKLHVRNIFRKLGVRNRVEAANGGRLAAPAAGRP